MTATLVVAVALLIGIAARAWGADTRDGDDWRRHHARAFLDAR